MKPVLLVIAPETFRDEELFETQKVLGDAGISTVIASTHTGTCTGKLGGTAEATIALKDANSKNYEAIAFIGGMGSEVYFKNAEARTIAHEFYDDDKIVSAICIAPVILANAGLLKGKQATVFPDGAETLRNCGAHYTGEAVTVDGNIITGNGPASSVAFGEMLASKIKEQAAS